MSSSPTDDRHRISVIECSIPEHLTIAAYRATRRRAPISSRRGERASSDPGADAAAGSSHLNRPKEVCMNASLAGRGGWHVVWMVLATAIAISVVGFVIADPSLAASNVGKNVGKEIDTWAKALMLGAAGMVAIPILAKRDVAGGAVLALLVVLIGGFVFAPGEVKTVIGGLWKSIGG